MSVFTNKANPITGKMEWEMHDDDYDYNQEIARSSYADMLHDTERNVKYQIALESAIKLMHANGKPAHVLDIGTGTGLLAMMAARAGADTIIACEAFEPVGKCAQQVIKQNGFSDRIKVIPKRSTALTVGPKFHAHKELLEVVESDLVWRWNSLRPLQDNKEILVDTPLDVRNCAGAAAVHDIQLSQLSPKLFKDILSPEPVFRFDYSGRSPIVKERSTVQVLKAVNDGTAQAVFMWWDLVMDTKGEVILSCAPFWAHPSKPAHPNDIPWRDHWMQAVYYLPTPVPVMQGQELTLISSHDEFSLWFNLGLDLKLKDKDYLRPICSCSAHAALSRTRVGQINDEQRTIKYLKALKSSVNVNTICLSIGDSCLIALAAAKLGAKKVYCLESCSLMKRILENYVQYNKLGSKVVVLDESSVSQTVLDQTISEKINLVLSEPYHMGRLFGMAVEFKDLWKIRAPLRNVQGFEMKFFDELIDVSINRVDCKWEAQPLWEYPCNALSKPTQLLELDFASSIPENKLECSGSLDISGSGACNGIALWMDWVLDSKEENIVSTGPIAEIEIDHQNPAKMSDTLVDLK
ncbi:Protein arginine N-methyltransferase 7 [Frankliniella fusca]|uniref:Protein arginine N-methyltransferase 7 n=1 Tax=Frankliniella fusca TaxID=407009 RepID=A0AAE1GUG3_9NEOP|nr:Protein arginine N-methyltransferase 7 [Frankliniella fusca]